MRGTQGIYAATAAVLVVIAALSVVIYRATERDAVAAFAQIESAVARTVAIAIETEVKALSSSLRQLNTLPSVQMLDRDYTAQRVRDAFEGDESGTIRQVVRFDASQRRFAWSPGGELLENGAGGMAQDQEWAWFTDKAHMNEVRIGPVWWDAAAPAQWQVFAVPVWRVAASAETPVPPNTFNGVLAFVVDVERLVQTYARPAAVESMGGALSIDLGLGRRMIGITSSASTVGERITNLGEVAAHSEATSVSGNEVLAWSRLPVPGGLWTVVISTPYELASRGVRGAGMRQLGLVALLLVAVPVAAWSLVRRERHAEEQRLGLQLQLAQAQKMDAIGKLAGGVAHDFNNMLTAIIGYASLILEEVPPDSPIREEAAQIKRAADSAASLTQKLLAFSRRQMLQAEQLDVAALLEEMMPLVRRVIGAQIDLQWTAEPNLWPIVADPVQVEQSLINLAINSRDAMPDGGTLVITARNTPLPEGQRRGDHIVAPGDYVQVIVGDTGHGMDEETRVRMFEPFFTTKPKGRGTGLGLSTVYGIIKQSGAHISVASSPGHGTTIEMLFPSVAATVASPVSKAPVIEHSVQGHETILLVEDDPAVRELSRRTLDRHGYRVLAASCADDAVRIARDFHGPIAMLLSDVVMPGMQGPELAVHLRSQLPGLRVLFISGYAAGAITDEMLKDSDLLKKPFSSAGLTHAVRQVLDRA